MDFWTVFRDEYLTAEDLVAFAFTLDLYDKTMAPGDCWCIKAVNHPVLKDFSFAHTTYPRFKGRNARILSLALADKFYTEEKPIIVRRSKCDSEFCINPAHCYYGTRVDVHMESRRKQGVNMSPILINEIKNRRTQDSKKWTYKALSSQYKLPVHVVRRICQGITYDI